MKLSDIIKGTEYDLSLFTEAQITELENRIAERGTKEEQSIILHALYAERILKLHPKKSYANYIY